MRHGWLAVACVAAVACSKPPRSGDPKTGDLAIGDAGVATTSTAESDAAPPAPGCDWSSDDAARAAYQRLTGKRFPNEPNTGCVDRSTSFPGYVRFGDFAYDRGCAYGESMYRCRMGWPRMEVAIFADAGWTKGDDAARHKIAVDWLSEGEGAPLTSAPDGFTDNGARPADSGAPRARTFAPPTFTATPDGGFVVQYWSAASGGMLPETHYTLYTTAFAADGAMGETKTLDGFTHRLNAP
jgi:hypothetical protein